ncbi:MAG TPA: hypothetical protein VF698_06615 [Thermoanaerobaculia bacterium]|jgi:hypothetical protein
MDQRTLTDEFTLPNPEAGAHPLPRDPIELAAGADAAARSWAEFPYFEQRFAERGRRFATSDTGWLITLCSIEKGAALAQIGWLGSVLASRGMPQYLLERHLRHLHEALTEALPHRKKQYVVLQTGARMLERARRAQIDDEAFRELASAFRGREVEQMGVLLVAAVADEGGGIRSAVTSIEAWACDPERFRKPWIDAVRATIAAARAHRDRKR